MLNPKDSVHHLVVALMDKGVVDSSAEAIAETILGRYAYDEEAGETVADAYVRALKKAAQEIKDAERARAAAETAAGALFEINHAFGVDFDRAWTIKCGRPDPGPKPAAEEAAV